MSLLMEALRKAEQVKKQAAASGSLPTAAPPRAVSGTDAAEPPAAIFSGDEPLVIEVREVESEPSEEARVVLEAWEVPEKDGDTIGVQEADDPSSMPTAERPTMEGSTLPDTPNIASVVVPPQPGFANQDAAGGSAEVSRQAAQAVFLAKNRHKRQVFRRRVLGYGFFLVFGIFGAAGFLYMSAVNSPLPLQTGGAVNSPPTAAMPMVPQPKKPNVEVFSPDAVALTKVEKQEPLGRRPDTQLSSNSETLSSSSAASRRPVASPATIKPAVADATSAFLPSADLPGTVHFEPEPLAITGMAATAPPSISIAKRAAAPQNDVLLASANEAFEQGQYQQSRSRYHQILQEEPDHRGALLGLAALAVRGQDPILARDLYLRLLTRNPADPLAKAGLLSVMAGGDPARLESELKLLLEFHPNLPALFFLLGNHYAAGQRWNEAQQAYFNAVQAAGKGGSPVPDYSFNLAVSLEHLGQPAAAGRYYREALRLAEQRPAGFNRDAVQGRLADLEPEVGR